MRGHGKGHGKYEYRLIWATGPGKSRQMKLAQKPSAIRMALLRLASQEPWLGYSAGKLKKTWFKLHRMLQVPFESVIHMKTREVTAAIKDASRPIAWIRVEWRQVGAWTEMLDPLTTLRGPEADAADARVAAMLDMVDAMSADELAVWRKWRKEAQ